MDNKLKLDQLPDRIVLINLYVSQLILLTLGCLIMVLFQRRGWQDLNLWTSPPASDVLLWGIGFAAGVLLIDLMLYTKVPKKLIDDGGVNVKIFLRRPVWHIAVICAVVAICEEFLFRGILQHSIGLVWTSLLFALIHLRYLKKWLLSIFVFVISCGLGWIYVETGSLWTPMFAHFLINFVLGCFIHWKGEDVSYE